MSNTTANRLTRNDLARVFRQNYGAASKLARELKLSRATISKWFQGLMTSRRIEDAVRQRAMELCQSTGTPTDNLHSTELQIEC
jgi:hypothetical protein